MMEKPAFPGPILPGGTVTFLFTDIEGSTQLLDRLRDQYEVLISGHHQIIRDALAKWNGREIDTQGDAFFAVFPKASEAVKAVVEIQRAMHEREWPEDVQVRVRMGLHTGEPWLVEEGYMGMDVHRAARIGHVGYGGQVLLSDTTTSLVLDELPEGVFLLDLGRHRLKDMRRPEPIHQLVIEDLPSEFSPLKSLEALPALQAAAVGMTAPGAPRKVGPSPYRGLAAFRESDAELFFGREEFIDHLSEAVGERHLVAVIVGPSGSGKSSAVFAGLLPQLREDGRWLIVETRPGSRPFHALARALYPTLYETQDETERLVGSQKLAQAMRTGELSLFQVVSRALERHPDAQRMLLVIDQFEELFTHKPDPDAQRQFLDELIAAAAAESTYRRSPLVLLLTLRADFMGQALGHRPFADALQEGSLILGPMNRDELQAAVEKPAELAGAAFESGLVQRILDDVGQEPGNLPMLEFALTLLWERMEEGWMTHAAYDEIGRVDGALARYAEVVWAALDSEEQDATRPLFVQLVQPGEGTEDTRRVARRGELAADHWPLVQHLADKRLVVTGRGETGEETVEVVHEALIRSWDRLREWMMDDRAFRTWQEGLRVAQRSWEASDRDQGALLRGAPLALALEWLSENEEALAPLEKDFIEASNRERLRREAEEEVRRQRELETAQKLAETEHARAEEQAQSAQNLRRRAYILGGVLAIAAILAIAAVFFAQQSNNERQNSQRQAAILLANQAETDLAAGYHDRAVLLALEALENHPYTSQAERALGRVVSYNRALELYSGHDSAVTSVDWSPDGSQIATSSSDNTARVWDVPTGEELLVIDLPADTSDNRLDMGLVVKWTPDGNLLTMTGDRYLIGSQDYGLQQWDSISGERLFATDLPNEEEPEQGDLETSFTHNATGAAAEFGPESRRLATLGGDNTAIIWNTALETPQIVLEGHENDVNGITWSPDESMIATASEDGSVRLWDTASGDTLHILDTSGERAIVVTWSPDGTQLASAGSDGTVQLWDAESAELNSSIATNAGIIWSLVWSPDGERLVTGHDDSLIRIWDVSSGQLDETLSGHRGNITHLAWSPTNNQLVSSDGNGFVRLWNLSPRTAALSLPYQVTFDPSWSSDGRFIAYAGGDVFTGSEPPFFDIWDLDTTRPIVENLGESLGYYWWDVEYSKDDTLLLARGQREIWPDAPVAVQVIDAQTGEVLKSLSAPSLEENDFLRDTAWSPDDSQVAAATLEGNVFIWDYESGALLNTIQHRPAVIEVEWSPDGSKFVTAGSDSRALVWDAETWEILFSLEGHEPPAEVLSVEWSPDGSHILTTSGNPDLGATDTTARIWDGNTGEELLVIGGHPAAVWFGEWSPDGKRVVTTSIDGTTRIWDATTGDELLNLSTPNAYAPFVTWSPDGQHIAVGGYLMAAEVWRVWQSTEELIEYAKECCVFRDLTPEEREQFGLADQ